MQNSIHREYYIRPDYSSDTISDDEIDEIDDSIDLSDGETQDIENFLDSQEKEKENIMNQTTPSWAPSTPNPSAQPRSAWSWPSSGAGTNQGIWPTQPPVGHQPAVFPHNSWATRTTGSVPFGVPNWQGGQSIAPQPNVQQAPRTFEVPHKKLIVCDLLDCLTESALNGGGYGVAPRGTFDMKYRLDVWERLSLFTPEGFIIFCPTSIVQSPIWTDLRGNLTIAFSEYFQTPTHTIQLIEGDLPRNKKIDVIKRATEEVGGSRADFLLISGGGNLGGRLYRDSDIAKTAGVEFLEYGQLIQLR